MTISPWLTSLARRSRRALSAATSSPDPRPSYTTSAVSSATFDKDGSVKLHTSSEKLIYRPKAGSSQFTVGRLVFTETMRLGHEEQMRESTRKELRKYESPELRKMIAPILKGWASAKANLDVLELGPAYTTAIPEALSENLHSYHAVDFSQPYLQKQQEILQENPALAALCHMTVSDIYDLDKAKASCDLIFASCHPPLVSSSIEDKCAVLDKIHALLRAGGTFALFPWYFSEQPQAVNRHLLQLFQVRQVAYQKDWRARLFLILERR